MTKPYLLHITVEKNAIIGGDRKWVFRLKKDNCFGVAFYSVSCIIRKIVKPKKNTSCYSVTPFVRLSAHQWPQTVVVF